MTAPLLPAPPTDEQIVIVGEITFLTTDQVLSMISADTQLIANAKWARTLADIVLWDDLEDEAGDIKRVGPIEFFDNRSVEYRLSFRNRILARYGYPLLSTESGEATLAAVASLEWF